MEHPRRPATHLEFTVAIICALPLEVDAVDALFDYHWDDDGPPYNKALRDTNTYSTGSMGRHNVVLAHMPSEGKVNAAAVAANCRASFPKIKLAIVVGICGVVPFGPDGEVVLGDVIVSDAVVQYDLGRRIPEGFVRKDTLLDNLGRPNEEIRGLLAKLKSLRSKKMLQAKMARYMGVLEAEPGLAASYPGVIHDRLFDPTYRHVSDGLLCEDCGCDAKLVPRTRLEQDSQQPAVHIGLIASGDTVMRSGQERDTIAQNEGIIAFEMESAGVWDRFPCVVIKGACDYADSHKSQVWQRYAAATAAACMKAFLDFWAPSSDSSNFLLQKERISNLLKRLQTSPYRDRKDRNPNRVKGTCEWFTNHPRFRYWLENRASCLLWVSADPGCGKSVLAKYVVDHLLPPTKSRTTCYFFFKDDFEDQRSPESALCCILHQLFEQNKHLLNNEAALERFEFGTDIPPFRDLWNILIETINRSPEPLEIICILDALDECEEKGRSQFASALCEFYWSAQSLRTSSLKFLITSRPYIHIRRDFRSLEARLPTIHLSGEDEAEIEKISAEINIVIKNRVEHITTDLELVPNERQVLEDELLCIPNRTYLWVYLILEEVRNMIILTKGAIRSTIRMIPKTVEDAYEKILTRSHDIKKSQRLLHIIVAAVRPLSLREIGVALAIQPYHQSHDDIHAEMEPEERFRRSIRELCGLFITIRDSRVYLLHQSAKEFLVRTHQSRPGPPNPFSPLQWKASLWTGESNRILAEICIWYLLLDGLDEPPYPQWDSDYFFLAYSAVHWSVHVRYAHFEANIPNGVSKVCDTESQRFQNWFSFFWRATSLGPTPDFTTLMLGSFLGLETVITPLLTTGSCNLHAVDSRYERSSLSWAAENGHDKIVTLLLSKEKEATRSWWRSEYETETGRTIDLKDKVGRTPLSYAAANGHDTIVRTLLETGHVYGYQNDIRLRTPLSYAAENGHTSVIASLLQQPHVNADSPCLAKRSPLWYAVNGGYEGIVRMLLRVEDTQTDRKDIDGWTPVFCAARHGHDRVVKLLIRRKDVEVNIIAYDKLWNAAFTPLSIAALNGHERVVTLLLNQDGVDLNAPRFNGYAPLYSAVRSGNIEIAKLLVKQHDIELNATGKHNNTALCEAAQYGDVAIMELLLGQDGIAVNPRNVLGKTPLCLAAEAGHTTAVQLLLQTIGVDPNMEDANGNTPLSLAAANGHTSVIKLQLQKLCGDVNHQNRGGRSSLWLAAAGGYTPIVDLLIQKQADHNMKDSRLFLTPVSIAAYYGHEETVRFLLYTNRFDAGFLDHHRLELAPWVAGYWDQVMAYIRRGEGDIHPGSWENACLLWWASKYARIDVLAELLRADANTLGLTNERVELFLRTAAESGHDEIMKALLESEVFQSRAENLEGRTLLWIASKNGHTKMVNVCLATRDVDPNSKDAVYGRTPLFVAAAGGYDEVVEQLLAQSDVDPNLTNRSGETPLWAAAWNCHAVVTRQLLDRADVERDSLDKFGQTLLMEAAAKNRGDIVKVLLSDGQADPNAKDARGRTPLLKATENRHQSIVKLLLSDRRVDPNMKDLNGQTALLNAVGQNCLATIQLLLADHRLDPNAEDPFGQTSLLKAADCGFIDIVKLLLEDHRVDRHAQDTYGQTLSSIATKRGMHELESE